MPSRTIAVLDLGSQTFRLAVVTIIDGCPRVLLSRMCPVRLSAGMGNGGLIAPTALERGASALEEFGREIRSLGAGSVHAFGTEVFRRARNADVFLAMAGERGFPIRILSASDEAALAIAGARACLDQEDFPFLILDVGGGSTEVARVSGPAEHGSTSFAMGAVNLTERFLQVGLPSGPGLEGLSRHVQGVLAQSGISGAEAKDLVATGGTATTLAAVSLGLDLYDPARIRGRRVPKEELDAVIRMLASMPLDERRRVPGLQPERADIIVAGLVVMRAVLREAGLSSLVVADGGLLLGLVLNILEKESGCHVEPSRARGLYL